MTELPKKLYYSISEVSAYTGVKPHVLRYWESEFPTLKPRKNRAGNRSYREKDVSEIMTIKDLLYEKGFKIDGARKLLKAPAATRAEQLDLIGTSPGDARREKVARLKRDLNDLLDFVQDL